MKVKVTGMYRSDEGSEHGAPAVKHYDLEVVCQKGTTRGDILLLAEAELRAKDVKFDSLKTHTIRLLEE